MTREPLLLTDSLPSDLAIVIWMISVQFPPQILRAHYDAFYSSATLDALNSILFRITDAPDM